MPTTGWWIASARGGPRTHTGAVLQRSDETGHAMKRSVHASRIAWSVGLLVVAACIWFPCLHLVFRRDIRQYRTVDGLSPSARLLAATYLDVWANPDLRERELAAMRQLNPEWDFMSRTFMVLALSNMALRDHALQTRAIEIMDAIIADTLECERKGGYEHFLLGYGRQRDWVIGPPRSIFVDGEIAMMIAARRFVEEEPMYGPLLSGRIDAMVHRMRQSPVLCAESYPDECWLFCNTVALAAVRMADALDGTDHGEFLASWVRTGSARLAEPRTGILISAFGVDGTPAPAGFGPEGSSIWMAAHMLEVVDPELAADQYRRARKALGRSFLGFGYSREWPRGHEGTMDIDSGPVIPVFGASASASGLAILASAAFHDTAYFGELMTSLRCAGFPAERNGMLRFMAGNQVGDAVLLYAMVEGPLWDKVGRRVRQ